MAYYTTEVSSLAEKCDSCCICNEQFSTNAELATHLIHHTNEDKWKRLLFEHEKKNRDPPVISEQRKEQRKQEFLKRSFVREDRRKKKNPVSNAPLKKKRSQEKFIKSVPPPPLAHPEVWEILSDTDDETENQKSDATVLSNCFRLISGQSGEERKCDITKPSSATKIEDSRFLSNETKSVTVKSANREVSKNFNRVSRQKSKVKNSRISKALQLYKCSSCASEFNNPKLLREHLEIHEAPPRYFCHICSTRFTNKATLSKHLYMHIGECHFCHKTFSAKKDLLMHLKKHHVRFAV